MSAVVSGPIVMSAVVSGPIVMSAVVSGPVVSRACPTASGTAPASSNRYLVITPQPSAPGTVPPTSQAQIPSDIGPSPNPIPNQVPARPHPRVRAVGLRPRAGAALGDDASGPAREISRVRLQRPGHA